MITTLHSLRRTTLFPGLIAVVFAAQLTAAPFVVKDTTVATHKKSGVQIVKGTIEIPKNLKWAVEPYAEHDGLAEIQFKTDEEADDARDGERMAKLKDRRATRDRRYALSNLFWQCRQYSENHKGVGPATLKDLEELEGRAVPAGGIQGIHLVPSVSMKVKNEKDNWIWVEHTEPLLVDTTPAIDDGKHWVLNNKGTAERVEIDPELVKKLGIKIVPQALPHGERGKDDKKTETLTIYARVVGDPEKATIPGRDLETKAPFKIVWDLGDATEGEEAICSEWAEQRIWAMDPYLLRDAPIIRTWAERMIVQYGLEESVGDYYPELLGRGGDERFRGNTTNIMGMLGGRAAIQETLQLRNLRARAEKEEDWKPSLPIGDIAGVQVQAHPFEKMLDGKPGGTLPLAEWVPHDHFMAYFPQPEKVFSLLGGGSDFIFNAGSGATGRSASYLLKDRYRDALGLSEELMKRFLKTGAIEELAVTVPDLFLIDGTEMSVIMRTGKPLLTNTALALVGVPPGDGQTVKTNSKGEPVYWVRRGRILILSTNEQEVKAILEAKEREMGLGKSAELRYMLTQVPVTDETVAYAYFSDPFIRNLVGPKTKIGQLRRLLARAELEEASAGSLLAKYDGHGARATELPFLQERGYMRQPVYAADLNLNRGSLSKSGFYGTAAHMTSLLDQPLEKVSPEEKKAYDQYLTEYNRYWRRYFDPIAIRYEQKPEGQHEVETFILPLIENSLYGGLRQFLPGEDELVPLRVPIIEPAPIATISANLNEEAWLGALDGVSEAFEAMLGLDPTILDLIGPDVHLALQDADPIVTLGNGELQGMLGSFGGGGQNEMMWITAIASMITRPCTIHIGLEDPDQVRKLLSKMSWAPSETDEFGFGRGALYQITGKQKWIYKYSIEDIITFRFGIEVQDRYLVINNLPFSNHIKVTGNKLAPHGAVYFELNPEACVEQLPALFTSAAENMRTNAMSGAANLMPLLAAGADLETAQQRHRALFGFAPVHPGGGSWNWDPWEGGMVSSLYGSPWDHRQPEFNPDNEAVGLLQSVSNVNIGMQFEQDGLRSKVRWSVKK